MIKIIKKFKLYLLMIIFIIFGCSVKKDIKYIDEMLIYKDSYYTKDDNYIPVICEGDEIAIDGGLGIFGSYKYYLSALDVNSNIIYDGKNHWFKEGFIPPDDNIENIYKIYISTSFKGNLNEESQKIDIIVFDNIDKTYLSDIIIECPKNEVTIHNKYSFWLFIIYSDYEYMSIQYSVYYIDQEVYFCKYYDDEHLYKVNDNYKNYFINSIIEII